MPMNIKRAIGGGIGLFIALIGAPTAPALFQFAFTEILSWAMLIVVLTFLFVDLLFIASLFLN